MKITIAALLGIIFLAVITPAFSQEPAHHHHHHHRGAVAPVIVDSTGQMVGPYFPGGLTDEVFLPTNDANSTLVLMYVATSGLSLQSNESLVYTDTSCSGTPYMAIPNSSILNPNPSYLVVPPGFYAFFDNVLYYPQTGATPLKIIGGSSREVGSTTCNPDPSPSTLFAPALTVDLSRFVPPFRVVIK